jgi:hypothetical protein
LSASADAATAPWEARVSRAVRGLVPVWSAPAALRAVRTTVVAAGLFALCDQVIGNLQMATFAAFGSFATLLLASFSGGRYERLRAHTGLALVGTALITIGTLVTHSTALAALITLPVTFVVLFAGVLGPNAASGGIAAMLAYVLPVASPGTVSMIPDRLAGWWLASVAGTAAVLATMPRPREDPLRRAVAMCARALADEVRAGLAGDGAGEAMERCVEAQHSLLAIFNATPYRPLGVAAPDQAMANVVGLMEWCTALLGDAVSEHADLGRAVPSDRELFAASAGVLEDIAALFEGAGGEPDIEGLERQRRQALAASAAERPDDASFRGEAELGFHAQALAVAVLAAGADGLVAQRVLKPAQLDRIRQQFADSLGLATGGRGAGPASTALRHASVRSVWFVNSLRAAAALAVAVLIAKVSTVQHGFWVVLGTLSVLRSNASATGASALQALLGTVIGFIVGGALLVAIGASSTALWVVLPAAIFVAGYTPGTAPFAIGQAAFTVTIAVLFNLLAPVGWKVGIVRVEDVAIGCAVSVLVGAMLWPRGVSGVVANDLSDAFRVGASYLRQGVDWTAGLRGTAPDLAPATFTTATRLEDALRAFLAEQGGKRLEQPQLWRLVAGTMRLRLTAFAVSSLPPDPDQPATVRDPLDRRATAIAGWYERLAELLDPPRRASPQPLLPLQLAPDTVVSPQDGSRYGVWLCEHLDHLVEHLTELIAPATRVAELRRAPWWR